MREPSLRTSRLAIAGGIIAIIAVGGAGFFLGRTTAPESEVVAVPVIASPTPEPTPTVEPLLLLGRADIVSLAARAADAATSGEPIPEDVREAVDRRFELAIPFGCTGPSGENSRSPLRWRYDEETEALRLHVSPVSWSASDWGIENGSLIEAIEGFWITRPWSLAESCPEPAGQASATGMEPVTLPGQTLAVAQFFTGETRRDALRDGRAFESVQRVPQDEFDPSRGFRLLLTGRIDSLPGGGPVRCIQPAGIEQRPICAVAVSFDEVRIANPANGEVLATWALDGG